MGVLLAECEGKLKVIEYTELPADVSQFTLSASTGMFLFTMELIRYLYQQQEVSNCLSILRVKKPLSCSGPRKDMFRKQRMSGNVRDSFSTFSITLDQAQSWFVKEIKSTRHSKMLQEKKASKPLNRRSSYTTMKCIIEKTFLNFTQRSQRHRVLVFSFFAREKNEDSNFFALAKKLRCFYLRVPLCLMIPLCD